MTISSAIAALWLAWMITWALAAFWSDRPVRRAGFREEASSRAMLAAGAALLFIPAHGYSGRLRLWLPPLPLAWTCVVLVAAGIAVAWWARLYPGRLWSGTVTAKANHRVVDTGPYALVRHPIYSGLLLSIYATMIAKGTIWGIAGAALLTVGVVTKARLEERFLRSELGDAYDRYASRIPMLLPFAPARAG